MYASSKHLTAEASVIIDVDRESTNLAGVVFMSRGLEFLQSAKPPSLTDISPTRTEKNVALHRSPFPMFVRGRSGFAPINSCNTMTRALCKRSSGKATTATLSFLAVCSLP